MADIESRQAVIPPPVFRVHDDANLSTSLTSGNGGGIVEAAPKRVVGPQSQSTAETPIQIHEGAVVIVDAGSKEKSCSAQLWITPNDRIGKVLGTGWYT